MAEYSGLYNGKDGMKGFGSALREMTRIGREVSQGEESRWTMNRAMYIGDQWLSLNVSTGQVRTMARTGQLRSGRRRDVVNRLRPFTEGRIALYATEKPPFEVVPPDRDQQSVDGAKQAEKFIDAMWGENGWNIKGRFPELARAGEIDGHAWLYVNWNPRIGPTANLPIPVGPDGMPVMDREMLEVLEQTGQLKWIQPTKPLGDVEFRIVRAGALSIDPAMVSDFKDCRWAVETRALPKSEVEKIAGKELDQILKESANALGEFPAENSASLPDVNIDDGENNQNGRRVKGFLIVNEAWITPHGDWPEGAHCIWLDRAPGAPLHAEPWQDELPFHPFVPKPHGGNIIKSRGTVDDLSPVQMKLNRTYSSLGEWMDKVGNPPVIAPQGAIIGNEIYGAPGNLVEYNVGYEKPEFFRAPAEPAVSMGNYIIQLENEMAEIANLPNAARGVSPGGGVESNIAIINQQQTVEQQLSGSSAQLVSIYEWGISRALKMVAKFYKVPRMISAPGVSDSEEFAAFVGEMLQGASRFKIVGSIQPRSKAMEMQTLLQLGPLVQDKLAPYVGDLIKGDPSSFSESMSLDQERQKRKNRRIAAASAHPQAEAIFQNFQMDVQLYTQALQAAQQAIATMPPEPQPTQVPGMPLQPGQAEAAGMPPAQPPSPMEMLAQSGIKPPNLSDYMRRAGIDVPTVEWQDDPLVQLETLRRWALTDGFEKMPPIVIQLAREMQEALTSKSAEMLAAAASQTPDPQGSDPAEKGNPSAPKQPGQPAGSMSMKMPGG